MITQTKTLSGIIVVVLTIMLLQSCHQPDKDILRAVNGQLKRYPESSLQDIYKSFFQDEFGPGHLLDDSAGARQYLEYELSGMTSSGNHSAEMCGAGKNFVRVPLDLVKDSLISESSLFNAFLESASSFRLPDAESWKKKWNGIVDVIEGMNLNLPNFEEDKKALSDMLGKGETAVHHSRNYEGFYKPHYRIVGKEEWERLSASYIH